MWGIAKSLTRIYSTVKKELLQIARRPGAFLSLILGPFLIMALFGAGYSGVRRALDTVLVIPESTSLSREPGYYQDLVGPALRIVDIRSDATSARDDLARQVIDIVVVAPGDLEKTFREGRQSQIGVEYNQIDPVLKAYADFLAYRLAGEVNREILRRAVAEGETYAVRQGVDPQQIAIPPEVVAAPTIAVAQNLAPTSPNVLAFFGPAVFALILQHMAVTLSALSLVRERLSGTFELFRVSPVNGLEILLGKYVGFGIIAAIISAIVTGLLVGVLGIPMLGSPALFGLVIALLVLASLGVGLLISVVSDSERQAVQLSLLVLLGSVFFSGFVLPVQEFRPELQVVSYALPVTHGIRLLQDIMLRGGTVVEWQIWVLALVGAVLFVITGLLLQRSLKRA
ncbi:MAG: ABC transporter permease [Chloroflexi bacterium]|nr:ABC transporter permease [Chloroflexota bacterium]